MNTLVELTSQELDILPIDIYDDISQHCHLSRRLFSNRDTIAMVLMSLTSVSEPENVYVQFGATETNFHYYLRMGIKSLVHVLSEDHSRAKVVYWDQSIESLKKSIDRTSSFSKIPGVVRIPDRIKLVTYTYPK